MTPKRMAGMVVVLSEKELQRAKDHALFVSEKSKADGRKNRNGAESGMDSELFRQREIMGYVAELAAANFLGVPWEPQVDTFKSVPDLAPDWEVRCTGSNSLGLILRDNDPLDRRWILLQQLSEKKYKVLGWIKGADAAAASEWTNFGYSHRKKVRHCKRADLHKEFPDA